MKDWKKTLLGIALGVSIFFNAWPGDKPAVVQDAEPWVDLAVAVLDEPTPSDDGPVISRIVRVYDGDTVYVDIDAWPAIVGDNIGIRLNGIDTPEIRGSSDIEKTHAIFVRDFLEKKIRSASKLELKNVSRGKYFRLLGNIECDGVDVSQLLLDKGYAVPYNGGTRREWTAEMFKSWEIE